MAKRQLTPDEIRQNLRTLAQVDLAEVIHNLESILSDFGYLTVSERGRRALEKTRETRRQVGYIQSFLSDYPIEEEDLTGQAIG